MTTQELLGRTSLNTTQPTNLLNVNAQALQELVALPRRDGLSVGHSSNRPLFHEQLFALSGGKVQLQYEVVHRVCTLVNKKTDTEPHRQPCKVQPE